MRRLRSFVKYLALLVLLGLALESLSRNLRTWFAASGVGRAGPYEVRRDPDPALPEKAGLESWTIVRNGSPVFAEYFYKDSGVTISADMFKDGRLFLYFLRGPSPEQDLMGYVVYDSNGEAAFEYKDRGLDGLFNVRVNRKTKKVERWKDNSWEGNGGASPHSTNDKTEK